MCYCGVYARQLSYVGQYLAGPMLVSSKTSHKWEPVISEINLQIDRWEYIAQSPYAQYFAVRIPRWFRPIHI